MTARLPLHLSPTGNCQAHGTTERPCPHERAKRVLAKARADGTLTTEEPTDA